VIEGLESFGLPPTFPEACMPAAGARFIADCMKGMEKRAIMQIARRRGFMPTWTRLEHLGPGVYGLGLTVDRCGVPLLVRMKAVDQDPAAIAVKCEQQSLF